MTRRNRLPLPPPWTAPPFPGKCAPNTGTVRSSAAPIWPPASSKRAMLKIPTAQPGSTVTVTFPEGARPEQVIALAEARDTLGMPVGEGGEMLILEASLTPDGTLTFALPEFAQDPSCTALLLNVYWGENNAWYALALQTGENAPGPAKTLPMFAPGV